MPLIKGTASAAAGECLIHFGSMDEVKALADNIIRTYPSFIACAVERVFTKALYYEKCAVLKELYYKATRFTALILVSHFLGDPDTSPTRELQKLIAEMAMPSDSTWKNLFLQLAFLYKESSENSFYIDSVLDNASLLNEDMKGYEKAVTGSIRNPVYKKLSVLQAGVELRNALHHDNAMALTERDYEKIYPYYLDIVMTLLRTWSFMDGSRFVLAACENGSGYTVLHGKDQQSLDAGGAVLPDDDTADSSGFIYDRTLEVFHPLYPFILKFEELWDREGEFTFDMRGHRENVYIGRKSGVHRHDVEGYRRLKEMVGSKKIEMNIDLDKMGYHYLREFAGSTTGETLKSGYLGRKYIPECYVRRESLEAILEDFMKSDSMALLLTGKAGMGKSAFLADIAWRFLQAKDDGIIPIFINARDIRKVEGNNKPVFTLLRDNFMLKRDVGQMEEFVNKINEKLKAEPALRGRELPRVILLIDAVNESYLPSEIFDEIDGLISRIAYRSDRKTRRYEWLKIIFSIRSTGLMALRADMGDDSSLFRDESAYYHVTSRSNTESSGLGTEASDNSGEQAGSEVISTAIIEIGSLEEHEIRLAVEKYTRHSPKLSEKSINQAIIDKNIRYLGNPLYLSLFIKILENMDGSSLAAGPDAKDILEEYCRHITGGIYGKETKHILDSLCCFMVEKTLCAEVNTSLISEIVQTYRINARDRGELFYTDPVERLVSDGIIERRSKEEPGRPSEEYIVFTQQRMLEHLLKDYLISKYGGGSIDDSLPARLLEMEADFDEYNNSLASIMADMWEGGRIAAICRIDDVKNKERHKKVFEEAVFSNVENAIHMGEGQEALSELAESFGKKLSVLAGSDENLTHIGNIGGVLLWGAVRRLKDRSGSELIYEKVIEKALMILRTGFGHRRDYAMCLRYYGEICEIKGDIKNAIVNYRQALTLIRKLEIENTDHNSYILDECRILNRLGYIYRLQGKPEDSRQCLNASTALLVKLLANDPESDENRYYLYDALNKFGDLLFRHMGNPGKASEYYSEALGHTERLVSEYPSNDEYLDAMSTALTNLGDIYESGGNTSEALKYYKRAHSIIEKLVQKHTVRNEYIRAKYVILYKIGKVNYCEADYEKALEYYETSHITIKDMICANPSVERYKEDRSFILNAIADAIIETGDIDKAFDTYNEALEIKKELCGSNPDIVRYKTGVSYILESIGDIYSKRKKHDSALECYMESLEIEEELLKTNPGIPKYKRNIELTERSIGNILKAQGKTLSLTFYQKALKRARELCGEYPGNQNYFKDLSSLLNMIGDYFKEQGQGQECTEAYEESVGIMRLLHEKNPDSETYITSLIHPMDRLAHFHTGNGDLEKAYQFIGRVLELEEMLYEKNQKKYTRRYVLTLRDTGDYMEQCGKFLQAARYFRRAIRAAEDSGSTHAYRSLIIILKNRMNFNYNLNKQDDFKYLDALKAD